MSKDRTSALAKIYYSRSSTYDSSFHPALASHILQWASLPRDSNVLDLVCGTGLVALRAAQLVGPRGRVIGVDISEGMMDVGRQRAAEEELEVTFVNHDISDMSDLPALREVDKGFDLIVCCSSLVLLDDPKRALKHWAQHLAPGGRIVFDVLFEKANVGGAILEQIAGELGLAGDLLYTRSWIKSQESVREMIVGAGLKVNRVFETQSYGSQELDVQDASEIYEQCLKYTIAESGFRTPGSRNIARSRFTEALEQMADSRGKIHQKQQFYIGFAEEGSW